MAAFVENLRRPITTKEHSLLHSVPFRAIEYPLIKIPVTQLEPLPEFSEPWEEKIFFEQRKLTRGVSHEKIRILEGYRDIAHSRGVDFGRFMHPDYQRVKKGYKSTRGELAVKREEHKSREFVEQVKAVIRGERKRLPSSIDKDAQTISEEFTQRFGKQVSADSVEHALSVLKAEVSIRKTSQRSKRLAKISDYLHNLPQREHEYSVREVQYGIAVSQEEKRAVVREMKKLIPIEFLDIEGHASDPLVVELFQVAEAKRKAHQQEVEKKYPTIALDAISLAPLGTDGELHTHVDLAKRVIFISRKKATRYGPLAAGVGVVALVAEGVASVLNSHVQNPGNASASSLSQVAQHAPSFEDVASSAGPSKAENTQMPPFPVIEQSVAFADLAGLSFRTTAPTLPIPEAKPQNSGAIDTLLKQSAEPDAKIAIPVSSPDPKPSPSEEPVLPKVDPKPSAPVQPIPYSSDSAKVVNIIQPVKSEAPKPPVAPSPKPIVPESPKPVASLPAKPAAPESPKPPAEPIKPAVQEPQTPNIVFTAPKPPERVSQESVIQLVIKYFPEDPKTAVAVFAAESGLGKNFQNLGGAPAFGVAQVYLPAHRAKIDRRLREQGVVAPNTLISDAQRIEWLRDPNNNLMVAREIYDNAKGWGPWDVYRFGTYQRFLNLIS